MGKKSHNNGDNGDDFELYDDENGEELEEYEDELGIDESELQNIHFTVQCIKNPFPKASDEWAIVELLQKERPEGFEELKDVLMSLFDFDNFDMTPDEYAKEILYFMIENRVIKLD
ncbi:MAG: hypothetical protein ACP5JP_03385 [bacterium]